jgi:hypothetical protein
MGYKTGGFTHCFNNFPTVSQVLTPQETTLDSVYVEACKEDEFDEKPLWVNIAGPLLFQKVFTVLYMKFNKLFIRKYRSHRSDNDDVTPLNDSRNITNYSLPLLLYLPGTAVVIPFKVPELKACPRLWMTRRRSPLT